MIEKNVSPLLLFYPTSPVHVRDMQLVMARLPDWRCTALTYAPLDKVSPGIEAALLYHRISSIHLDEKIAFETKLPGDTAVLALGAVFEPFALALFAWAKFRGIPVIAVQEVAQLTLNQLDLNNYDAPFDRLFVASRQEHQRFLSLHYPEQMLRVSGLLANDRFSQVHVRRKQQVFVSLGPPAGKKPIVYTTSPVRSRLSLHNKDDQEFRDNILAHLADASRRIGRQLIVKLHPNENTEIIRRVIVNMIPEAVVVGREISMDDLFSNTGILVNRGNSQTSLDGVLRGIPTVIVACGLKTLFHEDGGAYIVETLPDLAVAIQSALENGPRDSSRIRAKHFFKPLGGVADYVAGEIKNLTGKSWPADELSWNWLIQSTLFVGRHDRALALCEELPCRSQWQKLVRLALQAHAEQRVSDAISSWLACAALDSTWFFPHYELAHGYQSIEQFDKAVEHAHKAIELHPPFHSLWHEIPMRVVIMASLRRKGDLTAATKQLRVLEKQGLVEIVPELLIEAAAQHGFFSDQLEAAQTCLEKAFEQLKRYPVDKAGDRHIFDRVMKQYVDLAEKYAQTGDSRRGTAALQGAIDVARLEMPVLNHLCPDLGELAERHEMAADYLFAEECYALAVQADPTDHWLRYRKSLMALKQRKLARAFHGLFTIARIPNAPRAIIEKILSPAGADRLSPYWPTSATSILKPLMLCLWMSGWFLRRFATAGLNDFYTSISGVVLVWLFVVRHFVRRLRAVSLSIRRLFYRIRSFLSFPFPARDDRTPNCPICSARGKFEYQNKQASLFRCLHCDHVWARDLPDDQTLSALYGDFGYWERDRYHQGITAIQESEQWQVYLDARIGILHRLELLAHPVHSTMKVFEIGCAEGMLLNELRKRGMEVMGCEMNRAVAAEGIKAFGIDILTAPFETIELPAKNFNLVVSFHTLEHLRHPLSVIGKVARILRSDGAILLEVPCGEEEYENTDHLHFFSETSLLRLLEKFFHTIEILDNSYTNSSGVRIGSIYGFGQGVKN